MKQWFATNWVSIFALLFSGFAALYSVCNETKNSVSRDKVKIELALAKLDSLNKEQKELWVQTIKESAYKEDFYLTQLEVQSGLVILYVSVLFGIFGIIGYAVFYKEMNDIRKDYNDFKDEQSLHLISLNKKVEEYDKKMHDSFEEVMIDFNNDYAELIALIATLQANSKNYFISFVMYLFAIERSISTLQDDSDKDSNTQHNITKWLDSALETIRKIADDKALINRHINTFASENISEITSKIDSFYSKVSSEAIGNIHQIHYILDKIIKDAQKTTLPNSNNPIESI